MEVIYRVANINDAEELKRLNDAFNGEGCNTVENIREGLAREDAETVFIAEGSNKLLGFCCGQMLKSVCYSVFYVEITEIYIDDLYQKQGIGKGLLNYVEDWYRQYDIHNFQLFTGNDNESAQKFYENVGYRRNDDILYRKRDWWKENQNNSN
ncbi:MAG TPA: GNAT family N-acetyltransferase [Lachnospiraceae bacterium]|nr:GNAT family N-acetyltransferase [Lachnospiraceae bacterium]